MSDITITIPRRVVKFLAAAIPPAIVALILSQMADTATAIVGALTGLAAQVALLSWLYPESRR